MSFYFYCLSYVFTFIHAKAFTEVVGGYWITFHTGVLPGVQSVTLSLIYFFSKGHYPSHILEQHLHPFLIPQRHAKNNRLFHALWLHKCFQFCFVLLCFGFFSDYQWTSAYFELIQIQQPFKISILALDDLMRKKNAY